MSKNERNGWTQRAIEEANPGRRSKLELVRKRLDSGYYLSEAVLDETARALLEKYQI